MRPKIGITLNLETKTEADGGYSDYPWYAMRQDYETVVTEAGGLPVYIGHQTSLLEDYLDAVDGLILTGGDIQMPDAFYTSGISEDTALTNSRLRFEMQLIRKAYERDMPILGICAGMQHLNVAFGGTLLRDVREVTDVEHRDKANDRKNIKHDVAVIEDTLLADITGAERMPINSCHYEAVKSMAPNFILSAKADDGIIEAMEAPEKSFCIGIQWHPEFLLNEQEPFIWKAFIQAAQMYRAKRGQ